VLRMVQFSAGGKAVRDSKREDSNMTVSDAWNWLRAARSKVSHRFDHCMRAGRLILGRPYRGARLGRGDRLCSHRAHWRRNQREIGSRQS